MDNLNNFCKSSEGFIVIGNFPRGYNTRAYDEKISCRNYKEVTRAVLKFMQKPSCYLIEIINCETMRSQRINDSCWK